MAVTLKAPNTRFRTYPIKGATLKEVWDSIVKKGPRDPHDRKKVAFLTTTTLAFDPDRGIYELAGRMRVEPRTSWNEAEVKVKNLELTLTSEILCPKRNAVRGLSLKAWAEWIRFYACALLHEREHVMKARNESEAIARELGALRGSGLGETEDKAKEFAVDDLKTQMFDTYIRGMQQRLDKIHKDFDKASKHGERKGAKLDTDIA